MAGLLLLLLAMAPLCAGCATANPPPVASPVAAATLPEPSPTPAPATAAPSPAPSLTPEPTQAPTPEPTAVEPVRLRVFCAGSLMIPFAAIEAAYEVQHPEIDVEVEAHGSIQVIRHVTDIHERIDVVAPADHALLSMLMYGANDPDTGQPYASWNIRYASNRVAICYTPESAYAADLTDDNWHEIVSRPGVHLGLSDPRFDALGYRQLMILQLAEAHYGRPRLFEDLILGRFAQPIRAIAEGAGVTIHVPELLQPMPRSTILMRGSSIQLIPLLESGDVDYIFEYESVAKQHGLHTIALPPELSLGNEAHAAAYGAVSVKLDFQRFAVVTPAFRGEPIAYGLTIPSNAPHPEEAAQFIAFLLGSEGQAIMAANQHPILSPARVDHPDRLPEVLKPLCVAD